MRRFLLACALLALVAVPRPAVADDRLSVIAGATLPNVFDVLDFVAAGAGFYKDEHVIVDKEYAGSAFTAAQLVATGKADVLESSVEPVLQGYEHGLRLQMFFTRSPRYSYVLGVLDGSPIRTLADFRGTTIGVMGLGTAAAVAGQSMLAGAGLTSSDYDFQPIGTASQALEAIVDKRVAGVSFPYVLLALYDVQEHVKMRVYRHPILKDIPNIAYEAAPATIAAKSDVLQRFTRAIAEAAVFVRVNPAVAARFFLEGAGMKVTPDSLQNELRLIELCRDDIAGGDPADKRIGYMPPQAMDLYSRFLVSVGLETQPVPSSAVVTNQFIAYANDFDHNAVSALARGTR
jgi:NitT/TauT family transport system substrate-binding protein